MLSQLLVVAVGEVGAELGNKEQEKEEEEAWAEL